MIIVLTLYYLLILTYTYIYVNISSSQVKTDDACFFFFHSDSNVLFLQKCNLITWFLHKLTFSYRLTYKDFLNAKAWYMVFILQIMQFKITYTAAGPGAVVVLREYFKQPPKGQQLNLKLIRAWKTFVRKMRGLG